MKSISSLIVSLIKLLNIVYYNIDLVEAIQGGTYAPNGEFTYQVSVMINGQHACGGAILDSKHVLSAAQCVLNEGGFFLDVTIEILFGVYFFDPWGLNKVKVDYVYILYDFRLPTRANQLYPVGIEDGDLAILEVHRHMPVDEHGDLESLKLPAPLRAGRSLYSKYMFAIANISGFGQTTGTNYLSASNLNNLPNRRSNQGAMTYISVKVQRQNYCSARFTRFSDNIWETHLCTMSDNDNPIGACIGDVGGPLVINKKIIGVLQVYINNCDDRYIPAIFCRVTSFKSFIENAVRGAFEADMRLANYTGTHVNEIEHPSRGR